MISKQYKSILSYIKFRFIVNRIIGFLYYPLRIINSIKFKFQRKHNYRLRILSFHDMSSKDEEKFERQLRWIMKNWDIIDPKIFEKVIRGQEKLKKDSLLLTFDDGTMSNFYVAKNILKKLNIRALFFVVSEYVLINNIKASKIFAAENIMLTNNLSDVPDNFENMKINHLKDLSKDGHIIGSHTLSHARLSSLSNQEIEKEINDGVNLLEELMGYPILHFAYPFGDIKSIGTDASHVACKRFQFTYTGMRGDNGETKHGSNLMRDSNDPNDSLWYMGVSLEGLFDRLYSKKINLINT